MDCRRLASGGLLRLVFVLTCGIVMPALDATPASALCANDDGQKNIQASAPAAGSNARGIKASVLSPVADANCGIVRSIAVVRSNGDFAEVGLYEHWSANLPHAFVAWDGDAGYNDWHSGSTLSENVLYSLRIQDGSGNFNWTGFQGSSVLHTTGTLPFNKGTPITNTESDDPPNDPAYGRFTTLGWCSQLQCSSWVNFNPSCWADTDSTGHLDLFSATQLYTQDGQSAGGCAGTT